MKYSKITLLSLSVLSLCVLGNIHHASNKHFVESATELNGVGVKFQAAETTSGEIEVSETYVQTGSLVDENGEHNYLRFATAVNLDDNSGITSLEYIRKVGDNEAIIPVEKVYKKIKAENDNYYSYSDNGLSLEETANEWYFACYTVELTTEEYKAKDFILKLQVNGETAKAYTAASLNDLRSNYHVVRFENEGELLGKQIVTENEAPAYIGEELTKESDGHEYTFGWDKELAPATEDATYSVEFKTQHIYGATTHTEVTSTENKNLYEISSCTVSGCEEKIVKEIGLLAQVELAHRQNTAATAKVQAAFNSYNAYNLTSDDSVEYTIISSKEADVTLSLGALSRGNVTYDNPTPFSFYKFILNDAELEADETTTLYTGNWGGWSIPGEAVVRTIHLEKGANVLSLVSKGLNLIHADYIKIDHDDDVSVTLSNGPLFDAVLGTPTYSASSSNGITTNASYLSKYSHGSNYRLMSTSFVEYKIQSDKDVDVAVIVDAGARDIISLEANKHIFDMFKVYVKDEVSEYGEILATDERAYDQRVYSVRNYGEFHTWRICNLSLKAGETYTLKLQARSQLHLEQIWFAHSTDAVVSLIQ